MKAITCVAAALAVLLPITAHADDTAAIAAHYSAAYGTCLDGAKGVRAIQECNAAEIEYQEGALDREFQALLAARPADRERLQTEENHWSDEKEAKCTVFSRRRGSLNSVKAQDCFRDETIRRRIAINGEKRG